MLSFINTFMLASGGGLWEKIASWYQNSLIRELLLYLKETYFSVELRAYENLRFDTNAPATFQSIIIALAVGVILAAGWSTYTRSVLGGFVRALLKEEANSPEKAKTLYELGFFRNAAVRRELWRGVDLRKIVKTVGENDGALAPDTAKTESEPTEEPTPTATAESVTEEKKEALTPEKPDFLTARYYIPEDLRYRAELRYRKRGSSWGLFAVTVVVAIVLAALLGRFLPDLLQLADNLITMTSPN